MATTPPMMTAPLSTMTVTITGDMGMDVPGLNIPRQRMRSRSFTQRLRGRLQHPVSSRKRAYDWR